MDGIDTLKREALLKCNAKILAARREYSAALKEIKALQKKLGLKPMCRLRKIVASDYSGLTATTVACEVLREGKALTIVELTIVVQRRGCWMILGPWRTRYGLGCSTTRGNFGGTQKGAGPSYLVMAM
jgi:hypothetical protein